MTRIGRFTLLVFTSFFSINALAQLSQDEALDAVDRRQALFKMIGYNNRILGEAWRSGEFDEASVVRGTQLIAMLAEIIPALFEIDTHENSGLVTKASSLIWDNQEEFVGLADNLVAGANEAVEILQTQGASGVKSAIDKISVNCGACHDRFRIR